MREQEANKREQMKVPELVEADPEVDIINGLVPQVLKLKPCMLTLVMKG